MMRLNGSGWTVHRDRLNNIRIDRSLSQPFHFYAIWQTLSDFMFSIIENFDKHTTDNFSLSLWILYSFQLRIEPILGIDSADIKSHVFVGIKYLLERIFSQPSVINEYTMQVFADSAVK